jgi:hypothetical protein
MGTNLFEESIAVAEDFRDLNEIERKVLIQKFIDSIIYDSKKFKAAVNMIKTWDLKNNNKND